MLHLSPPGPGLLNTLDLQGLPLASLARWLMRSRGDGLWTAAVLASLVVLFVGLLRLAFSLKATFLRREVSPSLAVSRMAAVTGALSGVVAYLRDLPHPDAPFGLLLGGLSATPWVLGVLVERIKKLE